MTTLFEARGAHGERPSLTTGERIGSVLEYQLAVNRRTWRGRIFSRFLSPVFFLLAMGIGLGGLVDDRAGGVDGVPYLHFVVPAIVAVQAMWVAIGESTFPVLGNIMWDRMYDTMLGTPLRLRDLLAGHVLAVVGHIIMATLIFVGVAAAFGGFPTWGAVWCIPVAVLTGLAFTLPVFAFTARQEQDGGFNILFRMVVTPLMLFSGTFFPVAQLPVVLQPIAWVTPLWHGVEAGRALSLGRVDPPWLLLHLGVLVTFVVVGWVLAERSFTRRLIK
ncbi:ABC transporter permease [Antribacter gilvus]|uniref:ABC transporter permease n=1 Tax=Antribacter gilvus TaxID=2304675 RepID=UPI000F7A4BC1|nr:ABC transporter permease [Antribacter gilvus]